MFVKIQDQPFSGIHGTKTGHLNEHAIGSSFGTNQENLPRPPSSRRRNPGNPTKKPSQFDWTAAEETNEEQTADWHTNSTKHAAAEMATTGKTGSKRRPRAPAEANEHGPSHTHQSLN